jgi:uncharacterized protein (TIGR02147 family)
MNIFDYTVYREFLQALSRAKGQRGLQASLARAAGCQASYFSQVLNGRTHLTEDQALGIATHLEFSNVETEYLLLLLRHEKAGTQKLKEYLKNSIERVRKAQTDLSQRVKAEQIQIAEEELGKYLSSWIYAAVHMLTSSMDYQTPEKISARLALPLPKVKEALNFLKKLNFVDFSESRWKYKGGNMHVAKDSPWQASLQTQHRQLALRSISVNPEEAMHYSSVFTISAKEKEEIKKLIGQFIQSSHSLIGKSGTEDLTCLCIDLFTVI